MSEYLFAYGTLQPGLAPAEIADVVAGFEIAGVGFVHGTLYDLGSFPGAVLDAATSRRISGAVFRLPRDPHILDRLDEYEEYDPTSPRISPFIRRLHPVQMMNGEMLECWIYEYNGDRNDAPIMESGRYAP